MGWKICHSDSPPSNYLIRMKHKVLVTGATGFIGNYVVQELLNRGEEVIASSSDQRKAEKTPWYPRVGYRPFNLATFDKSGNYFDYFDRPDCMIHLAWEGLPAYKEDFHEQENLPRHRELLNNLLIHGLRDLTVTGTCFEYGMQEGLLRETMPVFPANPYARAKNSLREELEVMSRKKGISFKWVRLFYMYGTGQSANSLVSQLEKSLDAGEKLFNMSGGEQVRDFLPVTKVAEYLVTIALQQRVTGIINCCSGRPVTVREFVEDYLRKAGKKISLNLGYYPYPDYEPMRFWGDNTKLKSITEHE